MLNKDPVAREYEECDCYHCDSCGAKFAISFVFDQYEDLICCPVCGTRSDQSGNE